MEFKVTSKWIIPNYISLNFNEALQKIKRNIQQL